MLQINPGTSLYVDRDHNFDDHLYFYPFTLFSFNDSFVQEKSVVLSNEGSKPLFE